MSMIKIICIKQARKRSCQGGDIPLFSIHGDTACKSPGEKEKLEYSRYNGNTSTIYSKILGTCLSLYCDIKNSIYYTTIFSNKHK